MPKVGNKNKMSIRLFCADEGAKFILTKPKKFCKKKCITIKYIVPYILDENRLAKWKGKTVVTIKDILFTDNAFLFKF